MKVLILTFGTRGVGETMNGGIWARVELARAMPATFTRLLQDCWSIASDGPGAGADLVVHNGQIIAGQPMS